MECSLGHAWGSLFGAFLKDSTHLQIGGRVSCNKKEKTSGTPSWVFLQNWETKIPPSPTPQNPKKRGEKKGAVPQNKNTRRLHFPRPDARPRPARRASMRRCSWRCSSRRCCSTRCSSSHEAPAPEPRRSRSAETLRSAFPSVPGSLFFGLGLIVALKEKVPTPFSGFEFAVDGKPLSSSGFWFEVALAEEKVPSSC